MPDAKSPEYASAAEALADKLLRAAGSRLKHYEGYTQNKILDVAQTALDGHDDLVKALRPFAKFAAILETMGGNTPHRGSFYSINSKAGEATLNVEDFNAALAALAKAGA